MKKVVLKHLYKTFDTKNGSVEALKDVSLEADEKDIYGVIGYSGAGKSTLIRCINLLEKPEQGEVLVDGQDICKLSTKDLRKKRKDIGMIFQQFNLFHARTVANNVAFPLLKSGLSKQEIQQKVADLLRLVELEDKANAYPSQLSGGQKQRVGIARSLASDPGILLCDEATSALDPQTTKSILSLLKKVNAELGITIVLITHEMGVVKAICNKVAIMSQGEIVESGTIVDIFSNPKQEATKQFIRATTSIDQIYEMIDTNNSMVALQKDEILLQLHYTSDTTKEALLANLIKHYNVTFNIIYANVEILENIPLGTLVMILQGSLEDRKEALIYIEQQGVKVEVMKQ